MSQPKSAPVPRARWSPAEDQAVRHAYYHTDTASDFLGSVRAAVPDAPERTVKAYLTYIYEKVIVEGESRRPVYEDMLKTQRKGVTRPSVEAPVSGGVTIPEYLNDVADGPLPVAPKAPVSNFSAPPSVGVKPDPKATVPRHYRVPVYTQTSFSHRDITDIFKVEGVRARDAVASGAIPSHDGDIRREVFMALHEAMSDGLTFDAACGVVREKFTETPIVPAEHLYAVPATEAPVEPDPNKVREGYIPNPYLKGPFAIVKNREAPTLDDPNSDAMDAFTVEEATLALGLSSSVPLLAAINRDGFPAVKIDGKYTITRADLKRVRALLESGLTIEEALKRAGAPAMGLSVTPPAEDSWTDYIAPLTPEESREAGTMTPDEGAVRDARSPASDHLPPPPAEIHVPEVAATEQRQWALEALGEGIFTVEQALKIAGVTDTPRNRWALELLGRGEITLAQAAKLLR